VYKPGMFEPRILNGPLTRALVFENPDRTLDEMLYKAGFEEVHRVEKTPDRARLLELIDGVRPHVIFKRSRLEIDEEVLEHAKDLFAVMLCCIGDDSVDKVAAASRGVLVLNDPRSNARSVAELVLGQVLMAARRIPDAWRETRNNEWGKTANGRFEIKGKTLGILGLGNIGKQVARLAEAFGVDVLFYDNDEAAVAVGETFEWTPTRSAEELFERSDFVTIHVSATDLTGESNVGMIKREWMLRLGHDRPDDSPRVLINAGRGSLLQPEDLRAAVEAGSVRQAFIDVFGDEPHSGVREWPNPYADLLGVHCTPHIGAATRDAQPRIARKMARTSRLLSTKGTVEDCVLAPKRRVEVPGAGAGRTVLAVVHADVRGTKKAVDDAIYAAGLDNLESAHRDFRDYHIAYDLSVLDRPLTDEQVQGLIADAKALTGREDAIRAVRQIPI
jgi:D-3-phosphoglycerate dehydrogenase / 2-oxoglutarate reductase